MPTARELNQKIADVSIGWSGSINTLAIPSKYATTEQRIQQAIALLTQTQNRMRESIAKLRTFLTV